jgi:hypothetical protein
MQNFEDKTSENRWKYPKKRILTREKRTASEFSSPSMASFLEVPQKEFLFGNFEYLLLLKCVSTERCQCTFVILKTLHIYIKLLGYIIYFGVYIIFLSSPSPPNPSRKA